MIGAINWDMSSELIDGWKTPNLYGLLFVSGLIMGYFLVKKMFKKEGIGEKELDKLVLYIVAGTIIGARLGHVFFYGPYWDVIDVEGVVLERGYFSHPGDIIKIWEGGLASHGAAVMLLIMLFIYSKKVVHKPFLWILDIISAPIAIAAMFIRLGNLVNHEIVGDPTNVPWAFSFSRYYDETRGIYDSTPRHPTQLYEAICYLIAFGILMFMYWKKDLWNKPGVVFGAFLIFIFGSRFFIEFLKLGQTARDFNLPINTGQILSLPLVLVGVFLVWKGLTKKELA